MKGQDILRLVEAIHSEKNIDREIVFEGLENALFSAARKKLGNTNDIFVEIDRKTGDITAFDGEKAIDPATLGRIAALTAKQVMIQKFREAERDVVYTKFIRKVGTLINGQVQRVERSNVIVKLDRAEGIIPWREQVPNETYNVGERIKCLVLEVKKVRQQVRIVLSRSSPDLLRHLFELEVPEVADQIIEIRELSRDAGHRAKVAVRSIDSNVDCVGACVGIRGSRIKHIVEELNGEKIDIVRWNESPDIFIRNAMKPAEINAINLDYDTKHARIFVDEDQLSLAIGRRGQNVRLASSLTGWALDLLTGTPDSYEERFQVAGRQPQGSAPPPASAESKLDTILPANPAPEAPANSGPTSGIAKLDALLAPPPAADAPDSPASTDADAPSTDAAPADAAPTDAAPADAAPADAAPADAVAADAVASEDEAAPAPVAEELASGEAPAEESQQEASEGAPIAASGEASENQEELTGGPRQGVDGA